MKLAQPGIFLYIILITLTNIYSQSFMLLRNSIYINNINGANKSGFLALKSNSYSIDSCFTYKNGDLH